MSATSRSPPRPPSTSRRPTRRSLAQSVLLPGTQAGAYFILVQGECRIDRRPAVHARGHSRCRWKS